MSNFEVPTLILSSPFEEPKERGCILEGLRGNELLVVNKLEETK